MSRDGKMVFRRINGRVVPIYVPEGGRVPHGKNVSGKEFKQQESSARKRKAVAVGSMFGASAASAAVSNVLGRIGAKQAGRLAGAEFRQFWGASSGRKSQLATKHLTKTHKLAQAHSRLIKGRKASAILSLGLMSAGLYNIGRKKKYEPVDIPGID